MKGIDTQIIGKKIGRITVIEYNYSCKRSRQTYWLCKCDCGNFKSIRRDSLTNNATRSCGCLQRDTNIKLKSKSFGESTRNEAWGIFKSGAIKRNLENKISYYEWLNLTQLDCHYCGIKPSTLQKSHSKNGDFCYNGIDRVNNSIGYTLENIVTACFTCNKMKGTLSYQDFIIQIRKITTNKKLYVATGTASSADWTILN